MPPTTSSSLADPLLPSFVDAPCSCRQCLRDRDERYCGLPAEASRMILCAVCGNKRCPHATDHRHPCTGSNEPGQPGSSY